jgi:hypothetical protein
MKRLLRLLIIIISDLSMLISHSSCTQDAYDKGEGEYSLLRADFVEAHTNGEKQVDYIITDDGEQLSLLKTYSAKWLTTADSVYRCALYYNKVKDDKGRETAEAVSMGEIPCPKVTPFSKLDKEMKTDPVKFESAWMSKTGKYLNLSLWLMTGSTTDEEAAHHLAIIQDTVMANPDQTRTAYLRLFHDQGGIPEYYSTQVYASILTSQIDADSIRISINTYKGSVIKTFYRIH